MQQLISVLMSTYKEPLAWIEAAIKSILNQTYKKLELIVVVDWPENIELLEYLTTLQSKDERIKIVKNSENRGLVYSLNKGFGFCQGKYIARMDADDISESTRLETQFKYLSMNEYDLVGSGLQFFWENQKLQVVEVKDEYSMCLEMLRRACCSPHPTWLFKREIFEMLGGYRNIDSCEDLDFLHRAARAGFRLGNVPKILLQYRNNPESISHLNADKQRTIRYFLTKQFRKKHDVTYEEYLEYVQSENYERNLRQVISINKWERYIVNNKESFIKRGIGILHLINKPLFLVEFKEKVRGKMISVYKQNHRKRI